MYISNKSKVIMAVIILILISFFIYKYFLAEEPPEFDLEIESSFEKSDNGIELKDVELLINESEEVKIIVDIKGAVNNPGVYQMEKEDRVIDAIEKAGGLLEEADLYQVNLAKTIYDEMEIIVPIKGELLTELSINIDNISSKSKEKININYASITELITLSGIGEEKAKAIIQYREKNGGFKKIEDIMNVSGIAEGTFEKIKANITV